MNYGISKRKIKKLANTRRSILADGLIYNIKPISSSNSDAYTMDVTRKYLTVPSGLFGDGLGNAYNMEKGIIFVHTGAIEDNAISETINTTFRNATKDVDPEETDGYQKALLKDPIAVTYINLGEILEALSKDILDFYVGRPWSEIILDYDTDAVSDDDMDEYNERLEDWKKRKYQFYSSQWGEISDFFEKDQRWDKMLLKWKSARRLAVDYYANITPDQPITPENALQGLTPDCGGDEISKKAMQIREFLADIFSDNPHSPEEACNLTTDTQCMQTAGEVIARETEQSPSNQLSI